MRNIFTYALVIHMRNLMHHSSQDLISKRLPQGEKKANETPTQEDADVSNMEWPAYLILNV